MAASEDKVVDSEEEDSAQAAVVSVAADKAELADSEVSDLMDPSCARPPLRGLNKSQDFVFMFNRSRPLSLDRGRQGNGIAAHSSVRFFSRP